MKKIAVVMALLMIAAPALATVTVTATCVTDPNTERGWVVVSYTADGNDVRAFALDITVSDGAIVDFEGLSDDYWIAPGSVEIEEGEILYGGEILASDEFPGTLPGLDSNGITIEMGSLYGPDENDPNNSGELFRFLVDSECDVSIAENTIRGGVVMEDPDEDPGLVLVGCHSPGPCMGDIADDFGFTLEPDGNVNLGDLFFVVNEMNAQYPAGDPSFIYDIGMPEGFENMDVAADDFGFTPGRNGTINLGDLFLIVNAMNAAYPAGDPTFAYNIGCQ